MQYSVGDDKDQVRQRKAEDFLVRNEKLPGLPQGLAEMHAGYMPVGGVLEGESFSHT